MKAIEAAYAKDGTAFTFAAMLNNDMLMRRKERRFFEDECLRGSNAHRYRQRCEQIHKRWKGFDPRPTADWMVDDDAAKERFATEQQVNELKAKVSELGVTVSGVHKTLMYWPVVLIILATIAALRG